MNTSIQCSMLLVLSFLFVQQMTAQSFLGKDAFGGKHNISLNFALGGTPEAGIAYTFRSGLFAGYNHDGFLGNPWDVQVGMNCKLGKGFQQGAKEFYAGVNALIGGGEEVYSTAPGAGMMLFFSLFRTPQASGNTATDMGIYAALLPGIYHDTYTFSLKVEAQKMLTQNANMHDIPPVDQLLNLEWGMDNPSPTSYIGFSGLAHLSGFFGESGNRSLYGVEIGGYRMPLQLGGNASESPLGSFKLDARLHLGWGI